MKKIRTHYDNLKVSRDAPPAVIRAAYRALSQKYHPDRNPRDIEAEKIMQLINRAYEVLSDDLKKREHDQWILSTEKSAHSTHSGTRYQEEPKQQRTHNKTTSEKTKPSDTDTGTYLHWRQYIVKYKISEVQLKNCIANGKVNAILKENVLYVKDKSPFGGIMTMIKTRLPVNWPAYTFFIMMAGVIIFALNDSSFNSSTEALDPYPVKPASKFIDPLAPEPRLEITPVFNKPEQLLPRNGDTRFFDMSTPIAPLKIITSGNTHFFVKLKDSITKVTALTVFVRAGYTASIKVPLGTYEITYASGKTWYGTHHLFGPDTTYTKADKLFHFVQNGRRISGFTMTLYKIANGNLHTRSIDPSLF